MSFSKVLPFVSSSSSSSGPVHAMCIIKVLIAQKARVLLRDPRLEYSRPEVPHWLT